MTDSVRILAGARPISAYLGIKPQQVTYWCRIGLLPHFRVGRTLCADPEALRAWKAEQQGKAASSDKA